MVPMGIFGQNGRFQGLWGFPMPLFGGPKGPNRSPWMCLTMSNLVQPMSNPFGAAGGAYVRKWPSLAEYGPFWGLWGPPVPFFGGPEGPNRSPWMCLTMSNLVQPMSNPFGFARNAIWGPIVLGDFWSLQGPFRTPQGPRNGSQTQKKVGALVNHHN